MTSNMETNIIVVFESFSQMNSEFTKFRKQHVTQTAATHTLKPRNLSSPTVELTTQEALLTNGGTNNPARQGQYD